MSKAQRPQRFIVIPPPALGAQRHPVAPTPRQTLRMMALSAAEAPRSHGGSTHSQGADDAAGSAMRPQRRAAASVSSSPPLKVVNRSAADGALLVEPQGAVTLDGLLAHAPRGSQVLEEQWYRLERPARPWSATQRRLQAPRVRAAHSQLWPVTVLLDGPRRRRLSDALVTVMVDEAKGVGVEVSTGRDGRALVQLGAGVKRVDAVQVDPLHAGWPLRVADVQVAPDGLVLTVQPIALGAADARGLVYGPAGARAGEGVRVAVVDTGVGPHSALRVSRGLNTTTAESTRRWRDEHGHGSHVAGVIAAAAAGWRRGEASAVALHAYRVFEAGDPFASNFAIASAIKDAAVQGCDLVNLSIGDDVPDDAIRDAVAFAWARGCVCLAASGNDGRPQVDYPARYPKVLAVTAMGLRDSWPPAAWLDWTVGSHQGQTLAGRESFLAGFSNRGRKVALTAPGVGLVSTIHGERWGVMSGTSMAAPTATGVLARRLAADHAVRDLPRTAARAEAIVAMALGVAQDIGLPAHGQGRGLVR